LAHYTRLPPTDTRPPGNSRTAKASEYGFGSARRRHRLDTSILRDAFIRGYGTHDGVLHAHGLSTAEIRAGVDLAPNNAWAARLGWE